MSKPTMLGPMKKIPSGIQYVMCVIDQKTIWVDAVLLNWIMAKNTCDPLLQIFSRTGILTVAVSDNAKISTIK